MNNKRYNIEYIRVIRQFKYVKCIVCLTVFSGTPSPM